MSEPMTTCGYCAARMPERDFIRHDITRHDGYRRQQAWHQSLCERLGDCVCEVDEYRRAAVRLRLARLRGEGVTR